MFEASVGFAGSALYLFNIRIFAFILICNFFLSNLKKGDAFQEAGRTFIAQSHNSIGDSELK